MTIIGLDVGYGVTKLVNGQTITFPSVAGYARPLKFQAAEIQERYPGDQLTDDEGSWFVGHLALSQLNAASLLRLRGRTSGEVDGNQFRLRMMKAAIGKLFAYRDGRTVHLTIATGLPVDYMAADAGALKSVLAGPHRVQSDCVDFVANVAEVMVMPQPYGTIYRHLLTPDGSLDEYYSLERTGVIDVGTYTTDVAIDDDGEYIDERSGSIEAGVSLVQDVIAEEYERRYREKPSLKIVEEIIKRGFARIAGNPESFAEVVEAARERLYSSIQSLLSAKWGLAQDVDAIFVTGGGASLVYDQIHQAYNHAILTDNAATANAEGYLRYARFIKATS